MATVVLRPNVDVSLPAGWTVLPSGTAWAATDDEPAVDTSYAQHGTGTETAQLKLGFTTTVVPALAQIRSVAFRYRVALPSYVAGDNVQYRADIVAGGVGLLADTLNAGTVTAAIATVAGAARTTNPQGQPWTQTDIDTLEAWLYYHSGAVGNRTFRAYELYADVVTNLAPVATVTGPAEAGTVTASRPAVTWTYTDTEADAQERYQVKVFSQAQYEAAGFDPETSQATYSSGERFGAETTHTITVDLFNAITYRAYVKAADQGSGGRYSAWDYNQFTTSLTPAAPPTLTATAVPAGGRVDLVVTATDTVGVRAILEYSDDGGASWIRHRSGNLVPMSEPAPGSVTLSDHELRSGLSRQYRARVTDIGETRTSNPSAVVAVVLTLTSWWLKDPINSTANQAIYVEGEDWFAVERPQDVGVFAPLGRDRKVVIVGPVRGAEMAFTIFAENQAKRDGLEALRTSGRTLLLQSAQGEEWYIRPTAWRERRSGQGLLRWRIEVAAVEVDPPEGPEQGEQTFILDVSVLG